MAKSKNNNKQQNFKAQESSAGSQQSKKADMKSDQNKSR